MPLFNWSDNFNINVKEVDEQHKKLVDMINELHDAMKAGKGKEVLGKTFNGIVQYVATHFATEEGLMTKYNYSGYMQHKTEHTRLTQKALELKNEFEKGTPVLTLEVMSFLKDWLSHHISGIDKKVGEFLNTKGVF